MLVQARQAGLLAFCARLCSTEAGHELCSTMVTCARAATVRFIETAARFTWKRHGLCSSVSGLLQVDMSCVVVDVLVNVRSNKIRQETVCPCCLTCQLLRFLDLVVEQLVEVGDEIAGGGALLNDVANLLRQVH